MGDKFEQRIPFPRAKKSRIFGSRKSKDFLGKGKLKSKKMRKIKINRKAWLRILEAFLAVIVVLSAILIIMVKQKPETDISGDVYERQRQVLDIISKNNSLRNDILIQNNTRVNNLILNLIPENWNYSTSICNISLICSNPKQVYETEVYTTEIIITSNLTKYAPKKLRFFVWANE